MEVDISLMKCIILAQGFILYFSNVISQNATQIDDVTTSAYNQCAVGKTLCDDGQNCYYSITRCDGIPDCIDGSDETNCQSNTLPSSCPEQQKLCPDGRCINPNQDCSVLSLNTTRSTSHIQAESVTSTSDSVTSTMYFETLTSDLVSPILPSTQQDLSSVNGFVTPSIVTSNLLTIDSVPLTSVTNKYSDILFNTTLTKMSSASVSENTDIIVSTGIRPTASVSDALKTIPLSVALSPSSYYNENVTPSLPSPSSTLTSSLVNTNIFTLENRTSSTLSVQPTEICQTKSTILQSSSDIITSNTVGSLDTSSVSINRISTTLFSTIAPPIDKQLPPWIIAVIVCGIVVLLFPLILCVVCSKKRQREHKLPYKDPDDIGYSKSTYRNPEYNDHYDNKFLYEQPDKALPIGDTPYSFRSLRDSDFRTLDK